jgi:phage shock protein A
MSLFPRLKATLGAMFAPAENPRQEPASAYQRQLELVGRVRAALAEIAVSKRQLESRTESIHRTCALLRTQARVALEGGFTDIARLALQRRRAALAQLELLETQIGEISNEESRLMLAAQQLAAQIESIRARQDVLSARYTAAEAQLRIGEALAGVSGDLQALCEELERTEARTEDMQARSEAIQELMESGVLSAPAGLSGIGALDASQAGDVEADLRELLAEIVRGSL